VPSSYKATAAPATAAPPAEAPTTAQPAAAAEDSSLILYVSSWPTAPTGT
jgi:hypothetical protein